MSRLELSKHSHDGADRVTVVGELDLDSSPSLLAALRDSIERGRSVEVDLRAVSYIDSSGVAVLIRGYKLALKHGLRFGLSTPSAKVRAVLELSQLQDFFTIREDEPST